MFSLLESEVKKLPITWSSSHNKPQAQRKWLHAMSVVLYALAEYFFWIETNIYRPEDLDYLIKEIEPRVKQSLAHLVNGGFFAHGDTYTILATLLDYIDTITEAYESLRQSHNWESELGPIFKGVVKKYEKVVKERHEISPATPCIATDFKGNGTDSSDNSEINAEICAAVASSSAAIAQATATCSCLPQPPAFVGDKRKRNGNASK